VYANYGKIEGVLNDVSNFTEHRYRKTHKKQSVNVIAKINNNLAKSNKIFKTEQL